jgi:hypothetical protein
MAISFKYHKIKQPTLNLDLSFEASAAKGLDSEGHGGIYDIHNRNNKQQRRTTIVTRAHENTDDNHGHH